MQIESTVALISINATMIIQLVSFLIFLFIINRIMFRPLDLVKGTRAARMETLQQEIEAAEQEVHRIMDALAREELKAKEEALERQKLLELDAKAQTKQIFDGVKAEIDRLKVQSKEHVKAQIADVRQHLAGESQKLSRVIMEKTLERRLTDETI
ncbi:MAG: hypothetical protein KFF50_07525 [Desulfatitalea sp.]|nr:hypothetical protein [Desulfatitalea sp.]